MTPASTTAVSADATPLRLRVVMPVHDAEPYVAEALNSVLDDLPAGSEVVVVDDGSRDGSARIVAEIAQDDPRVRILTNPSATGVSRALNAGITTAGCPEHVAVAEHDDVVLPGRFTAQERALDEDPALGAVSSEGRYVGPGGRVTGRVAAGPSTAAELDGLRATGTAILVPHPAIMYRRDALLDVGLYDPTFDSAQDLEMINRLVYAGGWSVRILRETHFLYRIHPTALSFSHLSEQRMVTRYVAYRNRMQVAGSLPATYATWRADNRPSRRTRLSWWRRDRGAMHFRRAGLAWISRRPLQFAWHITGAVVLHPRWVVEKARVARGR